MAFQRPKTRPEVRDSATISVKEMTISGVRVLKILPIGLINEETSKAVIFFHGGGWSIGSPEGHFPITESVAERLNSVVYSVDYRLAPEHPFPAAFDVSGHTLAVKMGTHVFP